MDRNGHRLRPPRKAVEEGAKHLRVAPDWPYVLLAASIGAFVLVTLLSAI